MKKIHFSILVSLFSLIAILGCGQSQNAVSSSLAKLEIYPKNPTIVVGSSQRFRAIGYNSSNSTIYIPLPTWKVTGSSTIDPNGLYTAGNVQGTATIEATSGNVTASTQITIAYYSTPEISSIWTGKLSEEVTSGEQFDIYGENLGASASGNKVMVGSREATISEWADFNIKCLTPYGLASGINDVYVIKSGLSSNKKPILIVNPVIDHISPESGSVGSTVTIYGQYFGGWGYYAADGYISSSVEVNGIETECKSWADTMITLAVPINATNGNIVVKKNNVPSNAVLFTLETNPSSGSYKLEAYGTKSQLVLSADGRPQIVYKAWSSPSPLKYASWNGKEWVYETIEDTVDDVFLCKLSSDNPAVAYIKNSKLYYAAKAGSWQKEIVSDSGYSQCSMAVDDADTVHIAFNKLGLIYAVKQGGIWQVSTIESSSYCLGYPSIAIKSSSKPAVFYYNWENDVSKYAEFSGTDWIVETVEANSDGRAWPCLVFDSFDNPHVSYISNGNLVYSKKVAGIWQKQVVEEIPVAINYTGRISMLLDANEKPMIAYVKVINGEITQRVACLKEPGWEISTINSYRYENFIEYSGSLRLYDEKYRIISNVNDLITYYVQ